MHSVETRTGRQNIQLGVVWKGPVSKKVDCKKNTQTHRSRGNNISQKAGAEMTEPAKPRVGLDQMMEFARAPSRRYVFLASASFF